MSWCRAQGLDLAGLKCGEAVEIKPPAGGRLRLNRPNGAYLKPPCATLTTEIFEASINWREAFPPRRFLSRESNLGETTNASLSRGFTARGRSAAKSRAVRKYSRSCFGKIERLQAGSGSHQLRGGLSCFGTDEHGVTDAASDLVFPINENPRLTVSMAARFQDFPDS